VRRICPTSRGLSQQLILVVKTADGVLETLLRSRSSEAIIGPRLSIAVPDVALEIKMMLSCCLNKLWPLDKVRVPNLLE